MPSSYLDTLEPVPEDVYQILDLNRLVAYVIGVLQRQAIPSTFENVTVCAFRLFPVRFALEGYPQYPDAARVNRALLQLRPKYRNWAVGSVQKGFTLNQTGLNQAAIVEEAIRRSGPPASPGAHPRPGARPRTQDTMPELHHLLGSSLFRKWSEGSLGAATEIEFIDLLGAYSYTPPRALSNRVKYLREVALLHDRSDIARFLEDVSNRFRSLLHPASE